VNPPPPPPAPPVEPNEPNVADPLSPEGKEGAAVPKENNDGFAALVEAGGGAGEVIVVVVVKEGDGPGAVVVGFGSSHATHFSASEPFEIMQVGQDHFEPLDG
jgi:hypothetical protein